MTWNNDEAIYCPPPRETLYVKKDCELSSTNASVLRHFGIHKNVYSFNTISMKMLKLSELWNFLTLNKSYSRILVFFISHRVIWKANKNIL
jgi:hypothetical protein